MLLRSLQFWSPLVVCFPVLHGKQKQDGSTISYIRSVSANTEEMPTV